MPGRIVGRRTGRRWARGSLHVFLVAHRFVFYRNRVFFDAYHFDVTGTVTPHLVERQFAIAVLAAAVFVQICEQSYNRRLIFRITPRDNTTKTIHKHVYITVYTKKIVN